MIHHSASSQPRPAGRGLPRIRRWATGLAVAAIASLAGAPAALAGILPPPGGAVTDPVPPPPPPAPAAAHLPLWAVVTIVAATIVLSVATTLITLSLEHRRRARRTPAAGGPQVAAQTPSATTEHPAGQGEILSSHQHPAGYDMHRADSRLGPAALRQPPGGDPGRLPRTASPSATWRADPRTRQFPTRRTAGRDLDVVMKGIPRPRSAIPQPGDVRSRARHLTGGRVRLPK